MPWNPDDLIGCIFTFRIYLSSMCFEKNNMKTPFAHTVSKPASLGILPPRSPPRTCKQSWEDHFQFVKLRVYPRRQFSLKLSVLIACSYKNMQFLIYIRWSFIVQGRLDLQFFWGWLNVEVTVAMRWTCLQIVFWMRILGHCCTYTDECRSCISGISNHSLGPYILPFGTVNVDTLIVIRIIAQTTCSCQLRLSSLFSILCSCYASLVSLAFCSCIFP